MARCARAHGFAEPLLHVVGERREPAAWVPMADFDDDLYADVPCTD